MGDSQDAAGDLRLPRIAASSYLNTAPLIWSFLYGSMQGRVSIFTHEAPARCARMLHEHQVDAALVPVIQYQRFAELLIVPGVCVGSKREVRSVVLASKREDLSSIRSVAVDTSSRTSAALIEIIFREFVGSVPEFRPAEPDLRIMLENADAALLIGDPAMTFPRHELTVFDLATLWRKYTGLGFVFAMWMLRPESQWVLQNAKFASARDEGLANIEAIVADYARELNLPAGDLRSYLADNISFSLDEEMQAGLKLYFELAHKHGLITELVPLRIAPTA